MKRYAISPILFLLTALLTATYSWAFYDAEPSATPARTWGMDLQDVPLTWSPTKSVTEFDAIDTTAFLNTKIMVRPFVDSRKNTVEIGRNTEKRGSSADRLVTTKDNVPVWLTDKFIKTLNEFNVDETKNNAAVFLDAVILKFYVTESSTYKADIALNVTLTSKNGRLLWEGMLIGSAKNFGASYKEQNYHETISNAVLDLVYNMLKNEQIKQALKTLR